MKRVGLFFGSFNPIHIGHLIIANHLVENSDLDEVWFVVTPQSPFKQKKSLLDNHQRYELAYLATESYDHLSVSNIEFGLPQPNYTIDTLTHISEKYEGIQFAILMGEDNLKSFHKWKNYEVILSDYHIYTYPRISEGKIPKTFENHPKITNVKAPIIEISSTMIRKGIAEGKNVIPLLPSEVWKYIDEMNFYRK
jgi:nicotinate-nucleotide adenylyltransferase